MQVFAQMTQRDGAFILAREADENFTWEKLKGEKPAAGQKRRRTVYDVGICGQTTRHDPRC